MRGLRGRAEREKHLLCKQDDKELRALKVGGNVNTKGKILEQDLPNIIKNITYKTIVVCCKVRKLEELF